MGDVGDEIEIQVSVERGVEHVGQDGHLQRVAVRRRPHDHLGPDVAGGARPVVDHQRLAELIRQPLSDDARDDVGRAAGREGDDQAHRPRRISLREGDTRDGRQRHSARGQMQEITATKCHDVRPQLFAAGCPPL